MFPQHSLNGFPNWLVRLLRSRKRRALGTLIAVSLCSQGDALTLLHRLSRTLPRCEIRTDYNVIQPVSLCPYQWRTEQMLR